jgi:hypothetical protein
MKRKIIKSEPLGIYVVVGDQDSETIIEAMKITYEGGFDYAVKKTFRAKHPRHKGKVVFKAQQGQHPQTH